MVADAISWVCRSPRRLALFSVGLMAVVLIGSNLLTGGPAPGGSAARGGQPVPSVTAAQLPDATPFVTTAVRFVTAWSRLPKGATSVQWQSALAPMTTAELAQALKSTDPADLPDSAPDGEPVVRYLAQSSALVAVPLQNGSSVLVTVVNDGSATKVSDVQPFAGDN